MEIHYFLPKKERNPTRFDPMGVYFSVFLFSNAAIFHSHTRGSMDGSRALLVERRHKKILCCCCLIWELASKEKMDIRDAKRKISSLQQQS
jgi:hypothetical protein